MSDTFSNIDCLGAEHPGIPALREIHLPAGIELKNHVFLRSLLPCCAQLALPYWAKVIGKLYNNGTEDIMVRATVTLYGHGGTVLSQHSDTLALDPGGESGFEVKLDEFHDMVDQYSITVEDAGQL